MSIGQIVADATKKKNSDNLITKVQMLERFFPREFKDIPDILKTLFKDHIAYNVDSKKGNAILSLSDEKINNKVGHTCILHSTTFNRRKIRTIKTRKLNKVTLQDNGNYVVEDYADEQNVLRVLLSGTTHYGKSNKKSTAKDLIAINLDIDDVTPENLNNILKDVKNKKLPMPNMASTSGGGVHLWYFFDTPIPIDNDKRWNAASQLKKELEIIFRDDRYTSKRILTGNFQHHLGINQGCAVVGSSLKYKYIELIDKKYWKVKSFYGCEPYNLDDFLQLANIQLSENIVNTLKGIETDTKKIKKINKNFYDEIINPKTEIELNKFDKKIHGWLGTENKINHSIINKHNKLLKLLQTPHFIKVGNRKKSLCVFATVCREAGIPNCVAEQEINKIVEEFNKVAPIDHPIYDHEKEFAISYLYKDKEHNNLRPKIFGKGDKLNKFLNAEVFKDKKLRNYRTQEEHLALLHQSKKPYRAFDIYLDLTKENLNKKELISKYGSSTVYQYYDFCNNLISKEINSLDTKELEFINDAINYEINGKQTTHLTNEHIDKMKKSFLLQDKEEFEKVYKLDLDFVVQKINKMDTYTDKCKYLIKCLRSYNKKCKSRLFLLHQAKNSLIQKFNTTDSEEEKQEIINQDNLINKDVKRLVTIFKHNNNKFKKQFKSDLFSKEALNFLILEKREIMHAVTELTSEEKKNQVYGNIKFFNQFKRGYTNTINKLCNKFMDWTINSYSSTGFNDFVTKTLKSVNFNNYFIENHLYRTWKKWFLQIQPPKYSKFNGQMFSLLRNIESNIKENIKSYCRKNTIDIDSLTEVEFFVTYLADAKKLIYQFIEQFFIKFANKLNVEYDLDEDNQYYIETQHNDFECIKSIKLRKCSTI